MEKLAYSDYLEILSLVRDRIYSIRSDLSSSRFPVSSFYSAELAKYEKLHARLVDLECDIAD